jgi:murein DD-endopeptidase MepM/ murein hydrolase activator NlpD
LTALAVAAAGGTLVSAAPARTAASARASAAVVSGTLGSVAHVKASGDDGTSRSAPSSTPDGIELGGGSVSVFSTRTGQASAQAEAQARDVVLLGGAVSATLVRRTATDTGAGVRYGGTVSGLHVDGKLISGVRAGQHYPLSGGAGYVVASALGKGLEVRLTGALNGFPAGTDVVVADVSAHATAGASPSPTATNTPQPTATATATATPKPSATPKPGAPKPKATGYKRRLMGTQFVFPVRGATTIGGPFGAPRADTGFHEGNDLFADFGTPVVAVADGRVEMVGTLPISGNRLWVYADEGDTFFYAHLSAFSPEAVPGAKVKAGTVLGYVGNTGDAEPTPPHLHFEIHPKGGDAVDPHPFLVKWLARAGDLSADTAERPGALVEVRDFIGDE